MKKIASMNKREVLDTLNKLANLQNKLLNKLSSDNPYLDKASKFDLKIQKYWNDGVSLTFRPRPPDMGMVNKMTQSFNRIGKLLDEKCPPVKFTNPKNAETCCNDLGKYMRDHIMILSKNMNYEKMAPIIDKILQNESYYFIPLM